MKNATISKEKNSFSTDKAKAAAVSLWNAAAAFSVCVMNEK